MVKIVNMNTFTSVLRRCSYLLGLLFIKSRKKSDAFNFVKYGFSSVQKNYIPHRSRDIDENISI